ncbi:hypothetical protein [uncultured Chryseobacterium sp.]|uniref:hypothetical protein n=1 Tax=uncultured Chryseobacterium sp. TaxID=259322 RepID=UPI0025FD97E0|nr:hypothetical protein [uncultured Chryseobacterium sp.]
MDFSQETNSAIEKVIADKFPQMIEEKASKMIEDIISDIFRWGDVKDQIKKKIESSINVNLQNFDLIDYSALIGNVINENLISQINIQPIVDMTRDIVGFVDKKEITLSEISQMFIEAAIDENDRDSEGEITFIVNDEDVDRFKWIRVYADIEPNKEKRQCAFEFVVNIEKGYILTMYFNTWRGRKNVSKEFMTRLHGLEAKIFRLYAAQVKITDLDESIDTYWSRY